MVYILAKILRMFAINGSVTLCLGIALLNSWRCHTKLAICVVDTTLINHITAMLCYAINFIVTISVDFQLLLYPIVTYARVPRKQSTLYFPISF